MNKQYSDEEKAAFKAHRLQVRADLSALSRQIKMSPEWAEIANTLIITKSNGEELSALNKMLIAAQLKNASQVAGFVQWHKSGRNIRKGEKGIRIWVKGDKTSRPNPADDRPSETADDQPQANSPETSIYFVVGTVFDISQTEVAKEH